LSKVDLTLSIIILVGAYSGFRDGFRAELFSLLAIFLGVLFGFKFMGLAMVYLEEKFYIDSFALPYIAFGAVFFIILFLVNLVARLLVEKFEDPLLGQADPYLAGLFGLIRTTFMISILLWIFDSLKIEFPSEWTTNSWVWPMVTDFAPDTIEGIGKIIPFFRDIF
jgi:membrane protein required for colicin V production